jgi:hypothetical protein
VIEIMRDIRGYVMILLVLLWGFSVAFAVSMPNNQAFEDGSTDRPVGRATDILQSDRCAETAVFFAPFFFHEIIYQDRGKVGDPESMKKWPSLRDDDDAHTASRSVIFWRR